VDPNPLVGAVAVVGADVVGEGYHARCGGDHAEVVALQHAGDRARGATLYVTLEPCVHHGRTPPCTEAVVAAGVSRVVIAALDPDSRMRGRGVEALREAGIEVEVGLDEQPVVLSNMSYYKRQLGLGGTVTLKMATTMDGRIASAPGRRDSVTGEPAQRLVHQMRGQHDAVIVGINTLLADQPKLDCRFAENCDPPTPVVLDADLRFPGDYPWITDERPFIVVTSGESRSELSPVAEIIRAPVNNGHLDIGSALRGLSERGLDNVLVEGGAEVFSSFVDGGYWDTVFIFRSPRLYGLDGVPMFKGSALPSGPALVDTDVLGDDTVTRYVNPGSWNAIREEMSRVSAEGSR